MMRYYEKFLEPCPKCGGRMQDVRGTRGTLYFKCADCDYEFKFLHLAKLEQDGRQHPADIVAAINEFNKRAKK